MSPVTLFVPLDPAVPEGGYFLTFQFYEDIFLMKKKIFFSSLSLFEFGFSLRI